MGAPSVFLYVNIKAIFCLALAASLTNVVFTQHLLTSMLDDTRNALMSFSSGSSSPKLSTSFLPATPVKVSGCKYYSLISSTFSFSSQQSSNKYIYFLPKPNFGASIIFKGAVTLNSFSSNLSRNLVATQQLAANSN